MNNRGLLILFVIFIVLGIALLLQNQAIEQSTTPTPTPPFTRVFADLAVLDIHAIQVRDLRTQEVFTISRDQDGLWVAPYEDSPLIEGAGTSIAQTVAFLPYTNAIEITEETDLSQYGFNPVGYLLIEILLTNGESHVVSIGNALQTAPEFYIMVDDQPILYTAFRQPYDDLASLLDHPPLINR